MARLFGPEDFDPAKLTVSFENGSSVLEDLQVSQLLPRTYTLTHSDVTGHLQLSIGPRYNQEQVLLDDGLDLSSFSAGHLE